MSEDFNTIDENEEKKIKNNGKEENKIKEETPKREGLFIMKEENQEKGKEMEKEEAVNLIYEETKKEEKKEKDNALIKKELEETKTKLQDAESKIAQKDAIIEQMRNEQKKMAQKDELIRKMRKIIKEANIDFPEDDEFNKNNEKDDKKNKK